MSERKPTILVVDDDIRLRDLLERYLAEQGFAVKAVSDGTAMNKMLDQGTVDLMVLDLMLPGESGLDICRRLRGSGNDLPILMLTAKGDEIDRIVGLEMGADDYLPKPFNPRELTARIHAILRRKSKPGPTGAPDESGGIVNFGPYSLDLSARLLTKDADPISLTTGEFAVLKVFVSNPRKPLSRDKLMELARGKEHEAFDRSIDVQVSRLRKLIEADPSHPRYIQTVWGFGYVFVPDGGKQ